MEKVSIKRKFSKRNIAKLRGNSQRRKLGIVLVYKDISYSEKVTSKSRNLYKFIRSNSNNIILYCENGPDGEIKLI